MQFRCGPMQGSGYLRNISREGMFLEIDPVPDRGSEVQITIEAPGRGKVELTARVVWTTALRPESNDEALTGFGVMVSANQTAYLRFLDGVLLALAR